MSWVQTDVNQVGLYIMRYLFTNSPGPVKLVRKDCSRRFGTKNLIELVFCIVQFRLLDIFSNSSLFMPLVFII